jgi:hypothetical protein
VIDQSEFMSEERVGRKFVRQVGEQSASALRFMLALEGQREKNFRKRLQVMPLVGGELHFREPAFAVTVNSAKP